MDTVQPNPFCYDPFERPAFTPYTPAAELLANLDHSGHFLLSQIHALDGRLTHLCTDWWSGIERDYRSKSRMMGRGGEEWMEEMEQQEGKFEALHREFWTLEEDRTMMISSLEFAYVKKVSRGAFDIVMGQARLCDSWLAVLRSMIRQHRAMRSHRQAMTSGHCMMHPTPRRKKKVRRILESENDCSNIVCVKGFLENTLMWLWPFVQSIPTTVSRLLTQVIDRISHSFVLVTLSTSSQGVVYPNPSDKLQAISPTE